MKEISDGLIIAIKQSHAGISHKSLKWDLIYDTEEELVNDMFNEKIHVENVPFYKLCKGYEYIKSFRKYYTDCGTLTEKQMRQLKRLAAEIAYNIYCQ